VVILGRDFWLLRPQQVPDLYSNPYVVAWRDIRKRPFDGEGPWKPLSALRVQNLTFRRFLLRDRGKVKAIYMYISAGNKPYITAADDLDSDLHSTSRLGLGHGWRPVAGVNVQRA